MNLRSLAWSAGPRSSWVPRCGVAALVQMVGPARVALRYNADVAAERDEPAAGPNRLAVFPGGCAEVHRVRQRRRLLAGTAVLAVLLGLLAGPAAAVNVAHSVVVSADPAGTTPNVLDGQVNAIVQVGGKMIVGGTFTQVRRGGGANPGREPSRGRAGAARCQSPRRAHPRSLYRARDRGRRPRCHSNG